MGGVYGTAVPCAGYLLHSTCILLFYASVGHTDDTGAGWPMHYSLYSAGIRVNKDTMDIFAKFKFFCH